MTGRHLVEPLPSSEPSRGRHVKDGPVDGPVEHVDSQEAVMTTDDGRRPPLRLREPVRLYIYSVVSTGLLVALAYGLVSEEMVPMWTSLAATLLAVPAAEAARSKAWSPASVAELRAASAPDQGGSTYGGPRSRELG